MSATPPLHTAAVDALVLLLPTSAPLAVRADADPPSDLAGAVTILASFVGAVSADLALALVDADSIRAAAGTGSPLVGLEDVLRPALEAAAGTLGAGVLADSREGDASAVFHDPAAAVFELSEAGLVAGWFALRIRENEAVGADSRPAESTVIRKLGRISNVEMALTVEIGRTRMSVRDVLELEPGAVIELDRSAGAPADVLLNGRLIAHGEIVVLDQDYAVRITKILDVAEGH
ncbi:MAG TPA: flagellar motor switch protein FliN [Kribbella sp.]|jgi:flagellar motor switch protein FliN/FliY|nr:flagellar motor switch protein FliN [Cryobacterium sp.]